METVIKEQETQIEHLTRENLELKEQVEALKAKSAQDTRIFDHKLRELEEEKNKIKLRADRIQRQLTQVEIENETHQSQNRIKEEIIRDLTYKTSVLNEKMTMIQVESEETKNMGQEEVERMRERLHETEEELLALKKKR
jgi:hypothetical protein